MSHLHSIAILLGTFASVAALAATLPQATRQPVKSAPAQSAPAQSAPAQSPVPPTTLNCLLASNVFVQRSTDPKDKTLALQTLYFYLGRVNPQTSAQQFKSALQRTADGLKGVNAAPLMNACVRELQAKVELLQSVGQDLQKGK